MRESSASGAQRIGRHGADADAAQQHLLGRRTTEAHTEHDVGNGRAQLRKPTATMAPAPMMMRRLMVCALLAF